MKKIIFISGIFLLFFSCKTAQIKDKNMQGNVLFKTMTSRSKEVNSSYISGMFKITGIKEIPAGYMKFETQCDFNDKSVIFKIKALKMNLFDIVINKNEVIFINHTNSEYVKLQVKEIDLSKITGVNFNPIDLNYFFLGLVPYSETMELKDFKIEKNEYVLEITDSISKYTINLNNKKELTYINIVNQYFDAISIESIKYGLNENRKNIPKYLTVVSNDKTVKISFIINQTVKNKPDENFLDMSILNTYNKIDSLDKMTVNIKNQ